MKSQGIAVAGIPCDFVVLSFYLIKILLLRPFTSMT